MKGKVVFLLSLAIVALSSTQASASTDVANWNFEDQDLSVDLLDPLVPSATLTAGSGLSSSAFDAGNPPSATWAVEYSSWSTSGCSADDYLESTIDMSNLGGIILRFDERRSATGPTDYQLHYSVNGGGFTLMSGGTGTTTGSFGSNPMHTHTVAPGSADDLAMRGRANVRFRLYGCNSGGNGGKWRIDNFTFSATTGPTAVAMRQVSLSGDSHSWHKVVYILAGGSLLLTGATLHCQRWRQHDRTGHKKMQW